MENTNKKNIIECFNNNSKEFFSLDLNKKNIDKIIIDKKNKNKDKNKNYGNFEIIEKILYINTNNNEKIIYYNIDNKYYNKKYIEKYFKIIKINIDTKIYNAIIYNKNMIYIPEFINLIGKFELINNLLIITWENNVIFFNIFENDIYVKKEVPDFDTVYYNKKFPNLNNWYDIAKNYFINNTNYNDMSKIKINDNIYDIIINHSHLHIYNLNLNIYYKFNFNDDETLNVNINFFTIKDNNITFNTESHIFKQFIKNNDIYENNILDNNVLCNNDVLCNNEILL